MRKTDSVASEVFEARENWVGRCRDQGDVVERKSNEVCEEKCEHPSLTKESRKDVLDIPASMLSLTPYRRHRRSSRTESARERKGSISFHSLNVDLNWLTQRKRRRGTVPFDSCAAAPSHRSLSLTHSASSRTG
jgi:hypothetical protein